MVDKLALLILTRSYRTQKSRPNRDNTNEPVRTATILSSDIYIHTGVGRVSAPRIMLKRDSHPIFLPSFLILQNPPPLPQEKNHDLVDRNRHREKKKKNNRPLR